MTKSVNNDDSVNNDAYDVDSVINDDFNDPDSANDGLGDVNSLSTSNNDDS